MTVAAHVGVTSILSEFSSDLPEDLSDGGITFAGSKRSSLAGHRSQTKASPADTDGTAGPHPHATHASDDFGSAHQTSKRSRTTNREGVRRGKWTNEEQAYADRLIRDFEAGLLPLENGATLRAYLSKKLNCDPMRISKKFAGAKCLGKQIFLKRAGGSSAAQQPLSEPTGQRDDAALKRLEDAFLLSIANSGSGSNRRRNRTTPAAAQGGQQPLAGAVREMRGLAGSTGSAGGGVQLGVKAFNPHPLKGNHHSRMPKAARLSRSDSGGETDEGSLSDSDLGAGDLGGSIPHDLGDLRAFDVVHHRGASPVSLGASSAGSDCDDGGHSSCDDSDHGGYSGDPHGVMGCHHDYADGLVIEDMREAMNSLSAESGMDADCLPFDSMSGATVPHHVESHLHHPSSSSRGSHGAAGPGGGFTSLALTAHDHGGGVSALLHGPDLSGLGGDDTASASFHHRAATDLGSFDHGHHHLPAHAGAAPSAFSATNHHLQHPPHAQQEGCQPSSAAANPAPTSSTSCLASPLGLSSISLSMNHLNSASTGRSYDNLFAAGLMEPLCDFLPDECFIDVC